MGAAMLHSREFLVNSLLPKLVFLSPGILADIAATAGISKLVYCNKTLLCNINQDTRGKDIENHLKYGELLV